MAIVLETNKVADNETVSLKRKPEGKLVSLYLIIYRLGELVGGRPPKLMKEGLSDKTLGRRYDGLDDLVADKGMHLISSAQLISRCRIGEQLAQG